MDLFSKCKALYEKIRYFEYGIPVDGVIKPVPSAEYFVKNYHFLKPEEFEKYGGGICWDYVEYERKCLEVNDIDFNQYYIITNTPPNYDTHTFVTVKDGDDLIYIESSFKRVEHIIDGVQKFKSLEDIVKLITTNMWYCNDNDKHFDEFKYDVCKFKGHPKYGCTCQEYMDWMDDNSDIVIQDVTINPKKINEDELTVESVNFFQEGLFNFGKPKEPVDVMAKLSETFGELSEAQKEIINRPTNDRNPIGKFDFFVTPYSKYYYDMTIRVRKLDSFLKKESVLIGSVIGVPEGSVPVGMIDIIPDIDNVIKNYEAYEDGQLEYEDYYEQYIDDPRYGLGKVRVYADQNGAIYTCLSQDGKYTQVAKSYDEFVSKFNTYKFKLNKNEFTVSRRYSSRTGIDVFSNGLNTGDAEFTTTYKIDSDDIHTVALLYARFISFGVTQIFNMDADGDDEPDDFPVEYESHQQIETACAEHGIEHPFYPKMKVVELTFHKAPEPTVSYFVPSKITYVFALNESLDKPFMTVEVESGKVMSVKFNDSTIKEYADPEEYDETLHDHIADEDDVYNESWTDFKNGVHPSSNLMFHVSLKNDMDGKTITPQLPSYITDGGELDDNYQEDTKTKRLCVSPSIEGCLIAILNYKKIREHVGDKFYVYTPEKPFSQYKHKTNKEIVKDKLVFDANITKEAWILEPCKLKLYGIIKLKKVKDLKKKPTVEKGIKMNTIKLDYEWIMTPKASGKFNKAIGDSPNDESDNKEKPIKEYDNILVSNDEFFMEVSKYERRLNKQFQREYEKNPKRAKYDYVGNEKRPRNSDKYTRERINRVTQQRKDYEKASNIENSSVKTRNSSNKNKLKALKLLDYDPKTNTIKGNITLPDGSKKKRVPYIIENEVARNMGPFVGTIDEVRSMFDSIDFTNDKKPSSTELSRRQKVLNTLDQFEKNGEKFVIVIPRKFLNQRHLTGAGASLHELGHFTYIHDPNQSEETERAKTFRDSIKDKLTENTPSYMHLVKNPMGDISATYGIDESNEFSADKYAADRIGIKNYERMLKKLIKFGKKATNKAVISQINATETQLNLLKSSNGDSNYKEILNYIKGSAETFSRWSNEAQESVVQYKSKIKDLDKNIADINRKINEFKDHTSEISDELKELYKALESAKDERESAVEELKSKRESAKSNTDSADKLFNNASFAAQYKALKSSINNFKKWMDDYDVELNERINYIKKYHEKKNIGESCLIMDNDEFFGLME